MLADKAVGVLPRWQKGKPCFLAIAHGLHGDGHCALRGFLSSGVTIEAKINRIGNAKKLFKRCFAHGCAHGGNRFQKAMLA